MEFSPLLSYQVRYAIHTGRWREPGDASAGKTSAEPPVRLAGPWYLRNSRRAIWFLCTLVGAVGEPQHARRRLREAVIAVTPALPEAWIAQSITRQAMLGAATLIIAISARGALLP
jgi:hypothetical protein